MTVYNPAAWYWTVGGDTTRAYSSAASAYFSSNDATFTAWRDAGGAPTRILDEAELGAVLAAAGVPTGALPAPRREIPKSVVQERVNALGKLGAVFAILNSQPIYFARWFAPNWPNVYADDVGLLQVLGGAGCTADEIAQVTA